MADLASIVENGKGSGRIRAFTVHVPIRIPCPNLQRHRNSCQPGERLEKNYTFACVSEVNPQLWLLLLLCMSMRMHA